MGVVYFVLVAGATISLRQSSSDIPSLWKAPRRTESWIAWATTCHPAGRWWLGPGGNAAVPLVHLGTMFVHKRIVGHLGKFVAQCVHVDEGRRIAKNIVGDAVSSLVAKANTRIKILLST
jgi:hypothetical protein